METGAVYGHEYADGGWQRQTILTPTDPAGVDLFGQSVAVDDTTAVVGAPGAEDGAVFVFQREGGRLDPAGPCLCPGA